MGKIAEGSNKMHFTMLYGNYCYIFIEHIFLKFSACRRKKSIVYAKQKINNLAANALEFLDYLHLKNI